MDLHDIKGTLELATKKDKLFLKEFVLIRISFTHMRIKNSKNRCFVRFGDPQR